MIVDLKRIFLSYEKYLSMRINLDLTDVGQNAGVVFPEPISFDINITSRAGAVVFKAEANINFSFVCNRCNFIFNRSFYRRFSHIIVAELSEESNEDYIEAPDFKLDVEALLREDVLLELPSKLLCREDCKGLCPKCGKNLNEGECGCELKEPDPRMAALRSLLSDDEG